MFVDSLVGWGTVFVGFVSPTLGHNSVVSGFHLYLMAYYLVSAKPKPDRLLDLLSHLQDRAYLTMQPFGRSLTHSLENARAGEDGYAVWEEEDYCTPPLAQERAAGGCRESLGGNRGSRATPSISPTE